MLFLKAQEEVLKDIFVKIVKLHLAQDDDQNNFKRLSLKSTFYNAKLSNNLQ